MNQQRQPIRRIRRGVKGGAKNIQHFNTSFNIQARTTDDIERGNGEKEEEEVEEDEQMDVARDFTQLRAMEAHSKAYERSVKNRAHADELISILFWVIILGSLHIIGFILFLWLAFAPFIPFIIYYPQFSTDQPGPQINQHESIFFVCLIFSTIRLPVGVMYLWLMKKVGISWKTLLSLVITGISFVLELFCLVVTLYLWFTCNNSYSIPVISPGPWNPCNDVRFCEVYGNMYPAYCNAGSYTGLSPDALRPREEFIIYFWFVVAYIILDGLMFFFIVAIVDFKDGKK